MRKIKSFKLFESVIDKYSIKKEAEDNLVYLLDDTGWRIGIADYDKDILVGIYRLNNDTISLQSIKDEVIPYLELVSSKYKLNTKPFFINKSKKYNLQELEDLNVDIRDICFNIKK